MGKEPTFTRFKVSFSCATRWHNIEKARRVLGYEPEVGLDEGIKRMVDVSVPYENCSCELIMLAVVGVRTDELTRHLMIIFHVI
jgi:hypothetical protein